METNNKIDLWIEKEKEGTYFTLPFKIPDGICKIDIAYSYLRKRDKMDENGNLYSLEVSIVDFSLLDQNGEHIGSSGSDRSHITISESFATPGYTAMATNPGTWEIVVGAYKIEGEGIDVTYNITLTHKELKYYLGDTHVHSVGSDGIFTVEELVALALKNDLDYIFITDHNNYSQNMGLPKKEDLTIAPGMEWTNYKGHINFLGALKPYEGSLIANTEEEMKAKVAQARANGAIISVNHPFDNSCAFLFDLEQVNYDCIEIWNGGEERAIYSGLEWWQKKLVEGYKIPVIGGSDFHRFDEGSSGIGFPTTGLFAMSKNTSDLCEAIRNGQSFITYKPNGPEILMACGDKITGQTVRKPLSKCSITCSKLIMGDLIKVITESNETQYEIRDSLHTYRIEREIKETKFIRVELYRRHKANLEYRIAALSNPIYVT